MFYAIFKFRFKSGKTPSVFMLADIRLNAHKFRNYVFLL